MLHGYRCVIGGKSGTNAQFTQGRGNGYTIIATTKDYGLQVALHAHGMTNATSYKSWGKKLLSTVQK
jgi:hypothetical protein